MLMLIGDSFFLIKNLILFLRDKDVSKAFAR